MPKKEPTDETERKFFASATEASARERKAAEEKAERERVEREKTERELKEKERSTPKPTVQFSKPTPEEEFDDKAIDEIANGIGELFQTIGSIKSEAGKDVEPAVFKMGVMASYLQEGLLTFKINAVKQLSDDPAVQKSIKELMATMEGEDKYGDGKRYLDIDDVTGKISKLSHAVTKHLSGKTREPEKPAPKSPKGSSPKA